MPFSLLAPPVLVSFLFQQTKKKNGSALPLDLVKKEPPLWQEAADPFVCVAEELKLVEENLARSIQCQEAKLTEISSHLIEGGGKRVRPMITLLSFRLFDGARIQDAVDIATAIELIHTATLLHDDIIDRAETRRGRESAYRKFGLKNTLITGDFLFIKGFEYAGKFDETIVQWTADACTQLTEGEVLQGFFNRNTAVTVPDYLEIVTRKTASLFQTGARVGAYLAGASPSLIQAIGQYGLNLGIAFQIVDDILDIVGTELLLGKPTGMDLRDGNPSLPIILALREGHAAVADAFFGSQPEEEKIQAAIRAIEKSTAIDQAHALSRRYADKALDFVDHLPASVYRNGLRTMIQLISERQA
jgi:octaprenyl-diphosphate synthase